MATLPEVALVSPVRAALSVYVPAAAVPVMLQPAKVATPATALTVRLVHPRVPWADPAVARSVGRDGYKVTVPVSLVTTLPAESSTETWAWVAKFVPSMTPPTGWVLKASLAATRTEQTVTLVTVLVALKVCQTAVTVKDRLPAARPVSVQLSAVVGEAEVAQVPDGLPPSAVIQ